MTPAEKANRRIGCIICGTAICLAIGLPIALVRSCDSIMEKEDAYNADFMRRCVASGRDQFACEMYRDGRWTEEIKK